MAVAFGLSGLLIAAACGGGAPPAAGEEGGLDGELGAWDRAAPDLSVPASVSFGEPRADSVVAAVLDDHGTPPFAVYTRVAGLERIHRVDASMASLEVIAQAREQALQGLLTYLCAQPERARTLLEGAGEPAARSDADAPPGRFSDAVMEEFRTILARVERIEEALPRLADGDEPLIWAVEVMGRTDELRNLAADPLVRDLLPAPVPEPGEAAAVPPPTPAQPDSGADGALTPEPLEEVLAPMEALAAGRLEQCRDPRGPGETGPLPPPP